MKILILLGLLVSTFSYAQNRSFCERNRSDILTLMQETSARIGFDNAGGIGNGGVCWWHNRLQRSSFFLAKFQPDKSRPNAKQIADIVTGLRFMERVVIIPGYEDFESFTKANQKHIQQVLNDWQVYDGFYNFQWLRGISGNYMLPPKEMEVRMNSVYASYQKSPAAMWIMAQMKGITSHSFLILKMDQVNGGYDMDLIDSNHPMEIVTVKYTFGDQFLVTDRSKSKFVPYVGFQEDFRKISKGLVGYCRNKRMELLEDFAEIRDGEIELPSPGNQRNDLPLR
jgi:hypothetical protein